MPQNKSIGWLKSVTIERCFGIHHRVLAQRDVNPTSIKGTKHWSLDDIVEKCGDLIAKNLTPKDTAGNGQNLNELKLAETREKIRKLEIDNDIKAGVLIPSAQVDKQIGRGFKAIVDILEQIPTGVKMADPTVTQAQLESIKSTVNRIRNEAAAFRLDE